MNNEASLGEVLWLISRVLSVHGGKAWFERRIHPCPHCLTKFESPSARDIHARAVHEKWRDCSSLFGEKGAMVRHCRTVHERRRDHKCPHCSSRFGELGNMRQHCKAVHEKVRAHACPYCDGVAFGQMSTLNRHIDTVHLKLRDRACPYCKGVALLEPGYRHAWL